MMGSCGMSEELCYFCTEHKMRPLPAGKEGGRGIQDSFRLHVMICKTFQIAYRPVSGEKINYLSWVLEVSSTSAFALHQHLSSGRTMMWQEWRGHEGGEEEEAGG